MNATRHSSTGNRGSRGFTLIELMIVIAIIGILAAVAVPQYTTYTKRARFSEVVLATTAYKSSMEIAVQTGRATSVGVLDSGNFGIPANKTTGTSASGHVESVTALNGVITGVGTTDVDSAVYVIKATIPAGTSGIRWIEDDSDTNACQKIGVC